MDTDEVPEANPYTQGVANEPFGFFDDLRTRCPVANFPAGLGGRWWIVSRFDDVRTALRNPDVFSSDLESVSIGQDRPLIPLQVDPPDHAKYRRLMDPYFGPKEILKYEDGLRKLTNQVIDTFIDRDEINLHEVFTVPLPCTMFLQLVGLPLDDMGLFVEWKDNIVRPSVMGEEADRLRKQTGAKIYDYFSDVVADRRANPGADLISEFVHAEVDGAKLSDEEILDICFLFLLGGLDTVTATLDCSFAYLAQHPAQRQKIFDDPAQIPGMIEELLRSETPVMQVLRLVKQPITMHGVDMEPGDHVMVMLGAADCDPLEFDDPHEIDFDRGENRHVAFGGGPHRCLGSHFARQELRIAFEEFHRRIPGYHLAEGTELAYSPGIREVAELPLVITARESGQ